MGVKVLKRGAVKKSVVRIPQLLTEPAAHAFADWWYRPTGTD